MKRRVGLGLGLLLLVPAGTDRSVHGPRLQDGLVAALVVGTGCALAVAGLATLERDGRLTVPALLVRLGDASYSLQLVHVPVVTLSAIVAAVSCRARTGPSGSPGSCWSWPSSSSAARSRDCWPTASSSSPC